LFTLRKIVTFDLRQREPQKRAVVRFSRTDKPDLCHSMKKRRYGPENTAYQLLNCNLSHQFFSPYFIRHGLSIAATTQKHNHLLSFPRPPVHNLVAHTWRRGQSASRYPRCTPAPHGVCLRPDALRLPKFIKKLLRSKTLLLPQILRSQPTPFMQADLQTVEQSKQGDLSLIGACADCASAAKTQPHGQMPQRGTLPHLWCASSAPRPDRGATRFLSFPCAPVGAV